MILDYHHEVATSGLPPVDIIFGKTPAMQAARNTLEKVAKTNVPVLFQGEGGTGKEICVRLLHSLSHHSCGSLVKVSCPEIRHSLIEPELFGYENGALAGANEQKPGCVEQTRMGTLFLDEVGSLDLSVQSMLLGVLHDGDCVGVGGHEPRSIMMRLVSTTNRNLHHQVGDGTFRPDLLFRINTITINLPPLRQRIGDLPLLIDYFLEHYSKVFHYIPELLSSSAIRMMQNYHWPGNIRQLENLIRNYVLNGSEKALVAELMPEATPSVTVEIDADKPISLKDITRKATRNLERHIILRALQANQWNHKKTAQCLNISSRSLLYKLDKLD